MTPARKSWAAVLLTVMVVVGVVLGVYFAARRQGKKTVAPIGSIPSVTSAWPAQTPQSNAACQASPTITVGNAPTVQCDDVPCNRVTCDVSCNNASSSLPDSWVGAIAAPGCMQPANGVCACVQSDTIPFTMLGPDASQTMTGATPGESCDLFCNSSNVNQIPYYHAILAYRYYVGDLNPIAQSDIFGIVADRTSPFADSNGNCLCARNDAVPYDTLVGPPVQIPVQHDAKCQTVCNTDSVLLPYQKAAGADVASISGGTHMGPAFPVHDTCTCVTANNSLFGMASTSSLLTTQGWT
jgi:hypothetical protein